MASISLLLITEQIPVTSNDLTTFDRILFAYGVTPADIAISCSGDHLEIGCIQTDQVLVDNFFASPEPRVDAVQLADGSLLTATDIDAIVQQMSPYAVQEGRALSTLDDEHNNDALMTMVAGSWHAA